jgi:hypothetical protein
MGFSSPKVEVVPQKAAPQIDNDTVRQAGDAEAARQAKRRDMSDTIRTGAIARKRAGGLAAAYRQSVGG